jgi:hypothetical protein
MDNIRFSLICLFIAVFGAILVNFNQTSQISDLTKRTKNLEAALKAYNIPLTVEKE